MSTSVTTAPCVSVIWPVIVARPDWAARVGTKHHNIRKTGAINIRDIFIEIAPEICTHFSDINAPNHQNLYHASRNSVNCTSPTSEPRSTRGSLSSFGEFATGNGYLYQAKQVINFLQSHRFSF